MFENLGFVVQICFFSIGVIERDGKVAFCPSPRL